MCLQECPYASNPGWCRHEGARHCGVIPHQSRRMCRQEALTPPLRCMLLGVVCWRHLQCPSKSCPAIRQLLTRVASMGIDSASDPRHLHPRKARHKEKAWHNAAHDECFSKPLHLFLLVLMDGKRYSTVCSATLGRYPSCPSYCTLHRPGWLCGH